MATQQFDANKYKIRQRQEWDMVAEAWRKWWPVLERSAQQVSDLLAELAGVQPGQRVLDISTGIGEPAVTVARLVGPQGQVVATDQSPGMLSIAQQRLDELELKNVELIEADTEALDFGEEEFDAVVCRWGMMFLPNLNDALLRIRRALKTGGKFATSVWGTPDKVPFVSLPMAVAQRVLDPPPPPPPPDAPNLFKLGAPGAIESALHEAGFKNPTSEECTLQMWAESPVQYRDLIKDIAPPIRALVSERSPVLQEAYWEAVLEGARGFAAQDGSIRMPSVTILAVGTK